MQAIEQTLTSMEVAEMMRKSHCQLLRDIREYISQLGESKTGYSDFFQESTYTSRQNKVLPCYRITKKGCEFITHKLTGIKGTAFTARYINRFHEMEDILAKEEITINHIVSKDKQIYKANNTMRMIAHQSERLFSKAPIEYINDIAAVRPNSVTLDAAIDIFTIGYLYAKQNS